MLDDEARRDALRAAPLRRSASGWYGVPLYASTSLPKASSFFRSATSRASRSSPSSGQIAAAAANSAVARGVRLCRRPRAAESAHRRDLTVGVRRRLVLAQPLEGFGARANVGDVAEARREALLPALEPGERELEEVVPGRIARRREAVEVVVQRAT